MGKKAAMKQKTFFATDDTLSEILTWVREQLILFGISRPHLGKIELAIEEAVVNIIRHAYAEMKNEKVTIEIEYFPEAALHICIIDRGIPCNPLEKIRPLETDFSLEERIEGGLGLHLMCRIMDDVVYKRIDDTNQLLLIKKL